jgi:hypothetical protein
MSVTHAALHRESAGDLYAQRRHLIDQPDASADLLASVEERLRYHVYALGDVSIAEPKSKKQADLFVDLAVRRLHSDAAVRADVYVRAYHYLTAPGATRQAALDFMALFPLPSNETLLDFYRRDDTLRAPLFRLWRIQSAAVPPALVNAAAARSSPEPLKVEALAYAAQREEFGPGFFREHYSGGSADGASTGAASLEQSIAGGLMRGDAEAVRAMVVGIGHVADDHQRARLLRLAAVSGEAQFLPALEECARVRPALGCTLLAVTGRRTAVPSLLRQLDVVASAEAAASAWQRLTGQTIPRVPRLRVVGEEDDTGSASQPGLIPDSQAARQWWEDHQSHWPDAERRWFGRALTVERVARLAREHAGDTGREALLLLAMLRRRPVAIAAETWRAVLGDKLKMLTVASMPNAATVVRRHV